MKTIWNRMSSGTYFPPPVRSVGIPKKDGSERRLGIPTVADRIARTVVKMYLEPDVEPQFHPDSYGYRPRKSAIDALTTARQRCWRYDWVIDLDIRGFFDNLDHALVMRAARKYTRCRWILLMCSADRSHAAGRRNPGTAHDGNAPRGRREPAPGQVSSCTSRSTTGCGPHPDVPFERYADDIVAHCRTETQAQQVLAHIKRRLAQCRLEVHPEKTRIVYCKDDDRPGKYPTEQFTFLGYTFRSRRAKNRWGQYFISFIPAVSNAAATRMRQKMRRWHLPRRSDKAIDDLARMWNPVLRGWIQFYGRFYKSALYSVFRHFNDLLVRWAMRKYKRLRRHRRRAIHWLGGLARRAPRLFAHWHLLGLTPAAG